MREPMRPKLLCRKVDNRDYFRGLRKRQEQKPKSRIRRGGVRW